MAAGGGEGEAAARRQADGERRRRREAEEELARVREDLDRLHDELASLQVTLNLEP